MRDIESRGGVDGAEEEEEEEESGGQKGRGDFGDRSTFNEDPNEISNFLPEESLRRGKIEEPRWKDTLKQVMASCIVHCIVIQAGVNMAYSTVLIGGLQREVAVDNSTDHNNAIMMNENRESWIASLVTIALPIGSLVAGPLMDKFGRKKICMLVCIPTCLSWILLIFANSLTMIYVGRCIAGASAGLTSVGLIYVIEITHPRVRPMLTCLNSVFVSLGILLTCLFAPWLGWRQIAILFLAVNVTIFFGLFAIPESPYWLACFNDRPIKMSSRVEKSLSWLNPKTFMYEQEYDRLRETIARQRTRRHRSTETERDAADPRHAAKDKRWHLSVIETCLFYANQVSQPGVYKPLLLLLVVLLIQQLSGAYVIIFYAISVFREIGGTFGNGQLDEYGALLLLGVIRFVMSILTAYLSRTIGRRILCMASGLGMAFAMFFSAMLIHLTSIATTTTTTTTTTASATTDHFLASTLIQQKWLLLVVVLFYVCASTLGFIVIPWTLIGELLPISFRGFGTGLLISIAYVFMFAVVKSYPHLLLILGPRNIFFIFSLVSVLGTIFIYLFLPETLGKSFKQIEDYFAPDIREKKQIANANEKV